MIKMKMHLKILLALVIIFVQEPVLASKKSQANAAPSADALAMTRCMEEAGHYHNVNPQLLWAIAHTESRFRTVYHRNSDKNKTYDIGVMQINSAWLPKLQRYGISERSLLDPCTNIYVGAWVLADNISRFGYTWKAVGAYNSSLMNYQIAYTKRVADALAIGQRSIIRVTTAPSPHRQQQGGDGQPVSFQGGTSE